MITPQGACQNAMFVGKRQQRVVEQRLDGLVDAPGPGQPRRIGDAKVEEATCPVSSDH